MDQRNINYLKMTSSTVTGMEQEKSIWENEPEIVNCVANIKLNYEAIDGKNLIILGTDKTGITTAKDNMFENIIRDTYKLTRQMSAYAKINKDYPMLALVDLSISALSRGPQKEAADRCSALVEKAIQLIKELTTVKVNLPQLEALKQDIKKFHSTITEHSNISTSLAISGEEIIAGIVKIRSYFDILDDLVEGIIEDEGFIARYKSWRKIPDYGKGKTLKNPEKPAKP